MADMNHSRTASRRAILGAALVAPVMIVSTTAATGNPGPVANSRKWAALVAAFRHADEKMKAIGAEHTAAYERYAIEAQAIGPRPVKPVSCPINYPKPIEHMTIAEIKAMPSVVTDEERQYEADLAAWMAKDDEIERVITGDVDQRWEAAVDKQDKAAHAIFAEPAPDHHALSYKMALIEESYQGCDLDQDVMRQIFADARRLAAREA